MSIQTCLGEIESVDVTRLDGQGAPMGDPVFRGRATQKSSTLRLAGSPDVRSSGSYDVRQPLLVEVLTAGAGPVGTWMGQMRTTSPRVRHRFSWTASPRSDRNSASSRVQLSRKYLGGKVGDERDNVGWIDVGGRGVGAAQGLQYAGCLWKARSIALPEGRTVGRGCDRALTRISRSPPVPGQSYGPPGILREPKRP